MVIKCRFCDYQKEEPLSLDILRYIASNEDMPVEDLELWMRRLWKNHNFKNWNGIKVHIGIKHKDLTYKGIWPSISLTDKEETIFKQATAA